MKIIGGGLMSLVLAIVIVWNSGLIEPYQKARFTGFLNPAADDAKTGYHLSQSLIGIGSGGILGSRPSLNNDGSTSYAAQNVPEVTNRFYFCSNSRSMGIFRSYCVINSVWIFNL